MVTENGRKTMTLEQYVIQNIMWKQCLTEDQFKEMANKCLSVVDANSRHSQRGANEEMTPEMVSELVKRINRKIVDLHLQLCRGSNETDGSIHYALVNTGNNDLSRTAKRLSDKEVAYFRKLLSAIVESEDSSIPTMRALNLVREEDIKLTVTSAESLLNKWIQENWFDEISDGKVAVGVRTLLEMNIYLREHFAVQDCFRCKTLCIRGSDCVSCDIKMHFHCVDSRFIPNNKCPNCSKQWSRDETNTNGDEVTNDVEDDNEDTEEEEDNEEVIQRNRRSKRMKRL